MDPLTQGVIGAAFPQAIARKPKIIAAGLFGFAAGMVPDLDVLIQSDVDPLLYLEYHRQFTHSLIFVPIGGLICAVIFQVLFGRFFGLAFKQTWLFCALGFGTHGLLDAFTSYGTMLLWPFSDARFSWKIVSVVDPLFTVPIVVLLVLSIWKRRRGFAQLGLVWAGLYLGLGYMQQQTAISMGYVLAAERGHTPIRIEAKPSFGNLLVWKTVYETADAFYVDAVRVRVGPQVFPGASIAKLDVARDFPWLEQGTQQARDIERFRWFSDDYLACDPGNPNRIIDVRYSMVPNEIAALWSIGLDPAATAESHVDFSTHRGDVRAATERLKGLIFAR